MFFYQTATLTFACGSILLIEKILFHMRHLLLCFQYSGNPRLRDTNQLNPLIPGIHAPFHQSFLFQPGYDSSTCILSQTFTANLLNLASP